MVFPVHDAVLVFIGFSASDAAFFLQEVQARDAHANSDIAFYKLMFAHQLKTCKKELRRREHGLPV